MSDLELAYQVKFRRKRFVAVIATVNAPRWIDGIAFSRFALLCQIDGI